MTRGATEWDVGSDMSAHSNATRRIPQSLRRRLPIAVVSGLIAVVIGSLSGAAAAYDPARPTSNKHAPTTAPPPQASRIALGVANPDDRSMSDLDALTAMIGGNTPAIVAVKSAWGDPSTQDFPTATANGLAARGITPMIWWTPKGGADDEPYSRHRYINQGLHDKYIRDYARAVRDFGDMVLLRFAHEANGQYFPWSIHAYDNTPASFIAAWRRVHRLFQEEGATNARFVWSVSKEACVGGCNPYTDVYPGDDYVDVMGFSGYNWGAMKQWVSMYDTYRGVAAKLREIADKPVMVAETGSSELGGDKATWIRKGFPEVRERLPEIDAIVWTNADLRGINHPDWRIDSSGASLAAYAEIASLDEFTVQHPFSAFQGSRIRITARVDRARHRHAPAQTSRDDKQPARHREPRVQAGREADDSKVAAGAAPKAQRERKRRSRLPDGSDVEVVDPFTR
jgi:mannan endo-1,4-beta-mannosidase